MPPQLLGRDVGELALAAGEIEGDRAAIADVETGEDAAEAALARAGAADHRDDLARGEVEGDPAQHVGSLVLVAELEVAHAQPAAPARERIGARSRGSAGSSSSA